MNGVVFFGFVAVCLVAVTVSEDCASTCPPGGDPVCGTNGVTYDSMCELECAGATLEKEEACYPSDKCGCPLKLDPVCGTDNKTYGSMCFLNCANVELAKTGRC